jgi:uncharacterized protein (TIGR03000 family)
MSIEKKKMAAGLLGVVALACMGSTAQAQMMHGGRMGGMMMGGMMGGMRGPFMGQSSPMLSPFMGTLGALGLNSAANPFAMGFRGGYGMGGSGMGGGSGGTGGGYGLANGYSAGAHNYDSPNQQGELPHPSGDLKVAPANAAVIRLRILDRFAAVSFNGQNVSSIGTTRTYVTPNLEAGRNSTYEIKATWMAGNRQRSMEKVIEVKVGQISTADFTRE